MRVAAVLVLVAACGRIGIDPLATTDAVVVDAQQQPDAAPVPCAVEGSPCDDGNICTTTSSCMAGVCVGDEMNCTVARSMNEFADTQGIKGWFYGYWEVTGDPNGTYEPATEFQEFALFPGTMWRPPTWEAEPSPNFTWAYLQGWGGHPGSYPVVRVPIRRWVSDVTGHANAIVHLAKSDTGGDGTRAILVVDGVQLLSRDVAFDDFDGFIQIVPIELVVGSTVDLLLHPIGDDGADTSTMSLDVVSR